MGLKAAKQLYPNLEITLITREKFAGAARKVSWIEKVITLPTEELLDPIFSGKENESQALEHLFKWVYPITQETYDLVLNWTFSEASSYLCALMPGKIKLGYTRRRDLDFYCADGWSQYLQGVVQGNVPQNIHLTDILTTQLLTALQIHFGEPVDVGNAVATSKSFFTVNTGDEANSWSSGSSKRKWIAFQIDTGNPEKAWPTEHWAKLAQFILDKSEDYGIVLLGGQSSKESAKQITKGNTETEIINLVGLTDFDLWTNVIGSCQWLFSCDTAAIHLASVLGTRVINLSVGPVRFLETGPYGNGHYVITSTDNQKNEITPEAACGTWLYGISEWLHKRQTPIENHFDALDWNAELGKVNVFRSRVRSTNDGGGVYYELVNKRPMRMEQWIATTIGYIARAWYCGWVPPVGHELSRDVIGADLIKAIRELDDSTKVLLQICEEAKKTAMHLSKCTSLLKSERIMPAKKKEELKEFATKLSDLDDLIARLAKTNPSLLLFSQMNKVMMHNLHDMQLTEMGRESAECYRQLAEGAALFREWIAYTMKLAKPIAVQSHSKPSLDLVRAPEETL
jgi:ADP-heptose:LPS heptosyltransferase